MSGATDRQIRWLNELEQMLTAEEQGLIEDLQPVIEQVVAGIEELVADLPPDSPSRDIAWLAAAPEVERLLGRLNDKLRTELGRTLVGLQRPVRALAVTLSAGDTEAPLRGAGELLGSVRMNEETIAGWFRRQSPSRFMTSLRDGIDRAVRAGWMRDQAAKELAREVGAAARQLITNAVTTIARTALWDMANQETAAVWGEGRRFKYIAILDSATCAICRPWADQEGTINELPSPPLHPMCRCCRVAID